MLAIFKRECRSYFNGLLGYLLCAFMVLVNGLYFWALNLTYGMPDFGYYTLYRTMFILLIFVPILTMRSLAEERKNRTDQLLLTSPVSVQGIVLGKFFSLCVVFAIPCLVSVVMILTLAAAGATATATLANFACLLCYFFMGAAAIAVGEFISGLTENTIIAAIGTFAMLLLAYLMPSIQAMFTAGSVLAMIAFVAVLSIASVLVGLQTRSLTVGCVTFCACCALLVLLYQFKGTWLTTAFTWIMEKLSLFAPYEDFVNQIFSVPALVYYVLVAALFLFFSCQTLEKRRWNA